MKTAAIIVAAGSGSRFGSDTPKQFLEINGKPVIAHTIERFEASPSVDSIVVVLAADRIDVFDISPFSKVRNVVAGGASRAASVLNGLNTLVGETELVAVHDGARPLITVEEIESTVTKARETGAACLVAPVTDTIKSVRGGEVVETLDRNKLRRALTPQIFRFEVLKAAFEIADLDAATDECYLVERLGHPIAIVEGSPRNIKITHREDLILAEIMLRKELKANS